MFSLGLVSISFRSKSAEEIIALARAAQLDGIEWGGDIHVPPSDPAHASVVAAKTRDAGLTTICYGSYFHLGQDSLDGWADVIDVATQLQAPAIRVWAGKLASANADDAYRRRVVEAARQAAEQASDRGVVVAAEWHGGTLTDTVSSARRLLQDVAHPNFRTLWQPPVHMQHEDCLSNLSVAASWLYGIHVFHWALQSGERKPLAAGEPVWPEYLRRAIAAGAKFASLEFVKGDKPRQLIEDAATLRRWASAAKRSAAK